MRRIKLVLIAAVTAATLLMATAGLALAQQNRPENIRCNAQSADKGAIGPHEEGEVGTNPAVQYDLCPLAPPAYA